MKVLPATYSADAERLRRFEQEAQAAGALNHPNITAVHDFGTSSDGSPYIVTELLEGETLRGRLSGGALSVRKATDYAIQTAKGLAAAHEKGIVHRDLKPENLFVTNDGRVKILDFGLAKLTQADGATGPQTNLPTAAGTEPGVVMGTLGYMSPEQVKGKPADARSDIFSFGAILYEMLLGLARVPPGHGGRDDVGDPAGRAAGSVGDEQERAARARAGGAALPGEEPGGAVPLGARSGVRSRVDLGNVGLRHHGAAGRGRRASGRSRSSPARSPPPRCSAAGYFFGKAKGVSEPADLQAAHVPQGRDLERALRFRRQDHPHDRGLGRQTRPRSTSAARKARSHGLSACRGADVAAVSPTGDIAVILGADCDTAFTRAGTLAPCRRDRRRAARAAGKSRVRRLVARTARAL